QDLKPAWRFVDYPFSFSVVAVGTAPLTYYWMRGATVVQAGASPTYSGIASSASAGDYSCLVSNETGTMPSASAALQAVPLPSDYGSAVLASAPLAYWRLGESSGAVAHDGVGGNDGSYHSATL